MALYLILFPQAEGPPVQIEPVDLSVRSGVAPAAAVNGGKSTDRPAPISM